MMSVWRESLRRAWLIATAWLLIALSAPAFAEDKMQVLATSENGYGRIILEFNQRFDLPAYKLSADNNILVVTFNDPLSVLLPDLSGTLPGLLTTARVDPDYKGIRVGLRGGVTVHAMEAGEKLFIDLLPPGWQGLPPALPQEIVDELSRRAKDAAVVAEQKRRAEEAKTVRPVASVRVGRNPTFTRLDVVWSAPAKASYAVKGNVATLLFDWPVPIDLSVLAGNLPAEIKKVENTVSPKGSAIVFTLGNGVEPRYYAESDTSFTLDVDLSTAEVENKLLTAAQMAQLASEQQSSAEHAADAEIAAADAHGGGDDAHPPEEGLGPIVPVVSDVSGTVRVSFPFDRDTASAAFRRGDTLWLLFDTGTSIEKPDMSGALATIASAAQVYPAGDTQILKIDLSTDKLASLASEGRSWVLSLGDVLLNPTDPVQFNRLRDQDGRYEMTALLGKPAKVHSFRDPDVGDTLEVVTAFPPSRGTLRDLSYVDFDALRTIQGLVLRPDNPDLTVTVSDDHAVISAPAGLTLSEQTTQRAADGGEGTQMREAYINFASLREPDPGAFSRHAEELSADAATKDGQAQDVARLTLAQYYLGNQYAQEAIGVLKVLTASLKTPDLSRKVQLSSAIANVLAYRPQEALAILNGPTLSDEIDALMWRTIANTDANAFAQARSDALASESAVDSYPEWLQDRYYFSAVRAALETSDLTMAQRFIRKIDYSRLSPEDVSLYQLMQGWIAEQTGSDQEALDYYGQVIASDVRPTRAEAVYRTLLVLKDTGQIDLNKATNTLAAEAMLWRGDPLEVHMDKLLAELYFANKQYRPGFEVARQVAEADPSNPDVAELTDETAQVFADLFLNGAADDLPDVDALSLFYDFRTLTPPGAKGDEMIRNLAQRLVKVDLLAQAADLLQYQVDTRLTGVAKAQVAADLALIRIANRDPQSALRVLSKTELANLPPDLDRERRILQARALIDSDRSDMALDLLSRVTGRDAEQLRVDAYWKGKNYTAASNAIETMYADLAGEDLTPTARSNIIKAAVGAVLTNDQIGQSRLRAKFAEKLAQTPEWPLFDYLTGPTATIDGVEFKAAAKDVASIDQITAFLDSYRQTYGAGGITPDAPADPSR